MISFCLLKNRLLNHIFDTEGEEVYTRTNKKSTKRFDPKVKVKVEEPDVRGIQKVKLSHLKTECFEPNYSNIVSVIKTLDASQLEKLYVGYIIIVERSKHEKEFANEKSLLKSMLKAVAKQIHNRNPLSLSSKTTSAKRT